MNINIISLKETHQFRCIDSFIREILIDNARKGKEKERVWAGLLGLCHPDGHTRAGESGHGHGAGTSKVLLMTAVSPSITFT